MLRDEACGNLTKTDIGRDVHLCGWVRRIRNLGSLIFIDLWDRTGTVQVKFDPDISKDIMETATELHLEYVVLVNGTVSERPKDAVNPKIKTGEIEIIAKELKLLSRCAPLPFMIEGEEPTEEMRLKYRYLDLRRPRMLRNMILRHRAIKDIRDYLDEVGFIEIETPILMKSTPEGARDYLVPSRIHHGKFYALPQSPQMFKQLLMIAGFDRYFQIARCFRDEDLRADRTPEFTQLDLEMSFVEEKDIFALTEGLLGYVFEDVLGIKLEVPFRIISYSDAMGKYGTDKPDLRYNLELKYVTDIISEGTSEFIKKMKCEDVSFIAIVHSIGEKPPRKVLDEYESLAKGCGANGLIQFYLSGGKPQGALTRFYTEKQLSTLIERTQSKNGDIIQIVGDENKRLLEIMGRYRRALAEKLGMIKKADEYKFLWVVDFPLFEVMEDGKIGSAHHPFTAPKDEDIGLIDTDPLKVISRHYDLVCNGIELGSGSIRINNGTLQRKILKILGYTDKQIDERFGFFIEALEYGTPPHGGIAPGLDRIIALMAGEENIREVIAFPKTLKGISLMSGEPSEVDEEQLKELGIEIKGEDK
ncbi:MAG: aspartate--tRNA ligase [bacterium]